MAKKTRLEEVLGLLTIDEKQLAKELKVSVPRLRQLRTTLSIKQKDEHIQKARAFVTEVATKALDICGDFEVIVEEIHTKPLESMTKKELTEVAVSKGIEVPYNIKKSDLLDLVS